MATNFTKEEEIVFDDMVDGFEDFLSYGALAKKYEPLDGEEMVHTRDRFWIPQPMIGSSYDGFDQTSNFDGLTELAIPVSVGFHKVSPKLISAKNLRNTSALSIYADAAKEKLASDINVSLRNRVALEGSHFVKRTGAPTGFDDLALANAAMTRIGVPIRDRVAMIGLDAAIGMTGNLANRSESSTRSDEAYAEGKLASNVAGFNAYSDDQPIILGAAQGGATTVNGANQFLVPRGTYTEPDGEEVNQDNRYSLLTITAANYAGVKVGDAFTIAGVNALHMISKQDTGKAKTFRVVGKPSAGVIKVAPAIISNGGGTIAGKEYQNVSATPANGAAISWLNTVTAELNPFFRRDQLLLLPGTFTVDPKDGWNTMRATTPKLGIAIQYTRQGEINDLSVKSRWDIDYGTSLTNPEMAGALAFNQT